MSELFRDMKVKSNFHMGIEVKDPNLAIKREIAKFCVLKWEEEEETQTKSRFS